MIRSREKGGGRFLAQNAFRAFLFITGEWSMIRANQKHRCSSSSSKLYLSVNRSSVSHTSHIADIY